MPHAVNRRISRARALGLAAFAMLPLRGETQTLPTIAAGITATDDAAAALYGVESGLFRRAGLDVELQTVPSGAASLAALSGGTLQVGSSSAIAVVTSIAKGLPFEVIAPGGLYDSTTDFVATVVKKDSPIRTGSDFDGRTIASVSLQDLNMVAMLNWIEQHGGDPKTIKAIEVPYPALVPALEDGRIDATTLIQPGLSQGLAGGNIRIFAKTYDAISPHFYITMWLVRKDWAAANPDLVRRFASAIREAAAYANAHRSETAALVAPRAGIPLDVMLKGGRDTFATGPVDPREIQPVIDAAVKYKIIDQRLDASAMIAPEVRGLR